MSRARPVPRADAPITGVATSPSIAAVRPAAVATAPTIRPIVTAIGWSLPIALALPFSVARAQHPEVRIRTVERPLAIAPDGARLEDALRDGVFLERARTLVGRVDPNRAVLGVRLRSGTPADTAGLEVLDVVVDGPAAKAGVTEGARIIAVNGVSLRVSADDAADPLTADVAWRRLQRELGRVTAGDAVELQLRDASGTRTVRAETVAERDLRRARARTVAPLVEELRTSRASLEDRAALGMSLASAGNARDTLGVFITRVVTDGPADAAGIIEGDRISAINGVDLRVPKEDVSDPMAGQARVSRLQRELGKVAPGDTVRLRLVSAGRSRDVTVTAGKASEVGMEGVRFEFRTGPSAGFPALRSATPSRGRSAQ